MVVGSTHPLARRRKLRLADLQGLDWVLPTPESAAYPSVQAWFKGEGLSLPRRRVESVSILTNLGLLTRSDAVALMPQSAAGQFAQAGLLRILPLGGLEPFSEVGYTLRSGHLPSALTRRFVSELHEVSDKTLRRR